MKNILLSLPLFFCFTTWGQKNYPKIPFDSTLYKGKQNYVDAPQLKPKTDINIILIVADDLGKYDLSIYGNPIIHTPNIDAIGKRGILFNYGYATAAVCSPSRAGFITGRYQQRFGFHIQPHQRYPKNKFELWAFKNLINTGSLQPSEFGLYPSKEERKKMGLPTYEISIAEMLKHNGYKTAQIGKWHLGYSESLAPEKFGFDYTYGFKEAYSLYDDPKDKNVVNARIKEFTDKVIWKGKRKNACAIYENGKIIEEKEYLTYAIFRRAKQFIDQSIDTPFFEYIAVNAPHTPYQAPKVIYDSLDFIQSHNKRVYYAMIIALDHAIGNLVEHLKKNNEFDNTLIIFTSDNGAALYTQTVDNKPSNGGKFTYFEGGINVPFMMSCPQFNKQAQKINTPVSLLDIFPTIATVAQAKLPQDRKYDGISLSKCFVGDTSTIKERDALYWYSDYNLAIRIGNFKLILNDKDSTVDLYDLVRDPYELHNLSSNKKEIEKLKKALEKWKKTMPRMYWPRIMNYTIEINGKIYRWAV